MKKIYLIIFSILLCFSFSMTPKASTITGTTTDGLNMRKGAGTNYSVLFTISKGATVTLKSTNKVSGDGCSDGWYNITYNSTDGYVCSKYIKNITTTNDSTTDTSTVYNSSSWEYRVNSNGLTFRSGATTGSSSLGSLNYGSNLSYIDSASSGNGCNDKWYKVKYKNDTGYVCSTYVVKRTNVINNNATSSEKTAWSNAGFPSSYYPYLKYLKTKYPKASFTALKTNVNFKDAVNAEFKSNYIQSTDNALRAYSNQAETGGWYVAAKPTVAFYLDPRNFMNEKSVFVFENNYYLSAAHTKPVVESVFDGGTLKKYANDFITAGSEINISPVHLATRVRQEVGKNGNAATVGPYYNFFNIGAWSSCSNPLQCGLDYAKKQNWNTPVKSIKGGATTIKSYYNNNQKTRYLEKFNVANSNGRYSHQYMTNINAPYAEGSTAYDKYRSNNVLNSNWNFIIPVFSNMPAYTSFSNVDIASSRPSNVTGVSVKLNSYNSIKVSYNRANNANGYKIYYRKANTKEWKKFKTNSTSAVIENLDTGIKYFVMVKAYNSEYYSKEYSSTKSTITLAKPTISLKKVGSTKIKVSWSNIYNEKGYKIYMKTSANGKWKKVKTRSKLYSSWTDSNKIKGKTYYYRVRAYKKVDGKHIHSQYSDTVSIKR